MTDARINLAKAALKRVIRRSTDDYIEGKNKVAWSTALIATDGAERMMYAIWPDNRRMVDICYAPEELGYGDIGELVVSLSMDAYSLDKIAELTVTLTDLRFE